MASDDDDESLARFLESEVLCEISDQEEEKAEVFDDEYDDCVTKKMSHTEANTSDEVEGEEREALRKQVKEEDINEKAEMRKEEEENEEGEEKEANKMLIEEGDMRGEEEEEMEKKEREVKRRKVEEVDISNYGKSKTLSSALIMSSIEDEDESSPSKNNKTTILHNNDCGSSGKYRGVPGKIENGIFSKVPPELFCHILKFLSSEDLISCSLVCRFLNYASSDESLWRQLYTMRWGLLPPNRKLRECAWKKLYIQRDEQDLVELVRNCPSEFKEYYIQMQAAKRSQAPLPSQVLDDLVILDKTVSDQVSMWKSSRGLTDVILDHDCSGETCSYYRIGDVFLCERTGNVHVCGDTCREVGADPASGLLVCPISGRCFDRLLSPSEIEPDVELQQGGITDDAEPFMGSGLFARAYQLGYDCAGEKELEDTLRFCWFK